MSTETTTRARPRRGRFTSIAILFAVAIGCAYVGVRWHAWFEHWIPSAGSGGAPDASAGNPKSTKELWTCGMHPQVIQDHPGDCPICHMKLTPLVAIGGDAVASRAAAAESAVSIDPVVVQNMGVRLADVTEGPLNQTIRVAAMIDEPEPGHRDINMRVSGWIQTLYANTDGMEVKQGDPLFDLYSPELSQAIEEMILARKASNAPGSEANDPLRETNAALASAALARLLALGLTSAQIGELGALEHAPSMVTIVAPESGHITEKSGVYTGSAVTAGQRVLRIAQRSTMWIDGRVPEAELGRVRVGQDARANVDAYPGRAFDGTVIFIHPHFDDATRTALVRMAVKNPDYALHEGMYATVDIDVTGGEPAILAPREAIIDTGESQIVFVSAGGGRFQPRKVVTGMSGPDGRVQILSGLKPGEQVVASGQFLIDSESRLREAVAKFLSQGTSGGGATQPSSEPAPPRLPQIPADPAKVDAVVTAYLALAESLGATQASEVPLSTDAMVRAIREFSKGEVVAEGQRLLADAAGAAESLNGKALAQQRDLFKHLSAAVIRLVDAMSPSPEVAESLFVVNCPMVKADWLQRTRDVANPYFAQEMKQCGVVVRPVRTKGAK